MLIWQRSSRECRFHSFSLSVNKIWVSVWFGNPCYSYSWFAIWRWSRCWSGLHQKFPKAQMVAVALSFDVHSIYRLTRFSRLVLFTAKKMLKPCYGLDSYVTNRLIPSCMSWPFFVQDADSVSRAMMSAWATWRFWPMIFAEQAGFLRTSRCNATLRTSEPTDKSARCSVAEKWRWCYWYYREQSFS